MTNSSPPALLAIGTAVPSYVIDQVQLCTWMIEALGGEPHLARWLRYLYRASGINKRYSCLPDAELPAWQSRFSPKRSQAEVPGTAERMAIYERASIQIGLSAAQACLQQRSQATGQSEEQLRAGITHLIVVSCTGFFAPGLDFMIARELGLDSSVQRTIVGFMGCAAAFNAMRLATQIIQADAKAQVLLVCVELCTLHIQPGMQRTNLTVGALFADGAAACLVGRPDADDINIFLIQRFHTYMQPATEGDMAWKIGDHGFIMGLSPEIPRLLAAVAPGVLQTLFPAGQRPNFWAIHPGGRSIVDQLENVFRLSPEELVASRSILREYGNMSSPTILFVLQRILQQFQADQVPGQDGVAMAFGPGLVTEMLHLSYIPSVAQTQLAEMSHALA